MVHTIVSLLAASAFSISAVQSRSEPYVITMDGVYVEVGHDFEELQQHVRRKDVRLISTKGCVKVTASQNTQSLRMMCNSIDGTPKTPSKWIAHQCLPNGSGLGGGQISFTVDDFTAVEVPALDVEAKDAAYFEIMFDASEVTFDGFFSTTAREKEIVKSQKPWLPSNFRCTVGDLPTRDISKVSAYTIKRGLVDIDGDGDLDFIIDEAIELTMPVEQASSYLDWFRATDQADPIAKMLTIEYQDADNLAVFTLTVAVEIESLGFANMFLGDIATPGREIQVGLRAKGIISAKPSSGSPR